MRTFIIAALLFFSLVPRMEASSGCIAPIRMETQDLVTSPDGQIVLAINYSGELSANGGGYVAVFKPL